MSKPQALTAPGGVSLKRRAPEAPRPLNRQPGLRSNPRRVSRTIFDLYARGLGFRKIAHVLNERHAPAPKPRRTATVGCAELAQLDVVDGTRTLTAKAIEAAGARNLQSITDPLSHQTGFTYDAQGQPLTITTPAGTIQLTYDQGDLATITDPLGKITTRFTDPGGRLISVTSPMGRRTRYEWDPLNQLTKITDPLGGTTQLTYDPNGNLTGVRDARNNLTQYAPDSMDRVLTRTDALGNQSRVLAYDQNGNPTQVRDRKSQATQLLARRRAVLGLFVTPR